MALILSAHAAEMMEGRGIVLAWIEAPVGSPEFTELDPRNPALIRSYRPIPEAGGRVLRCVHRPEGAKVPIVTTHFDRGRRP